MQHQPRRRWTPGILTPRDLHPVRSGFPFHQ